MLNDPETKQALQEGLDNYEKFIHKMPAITQDVVDENNEILYSYEFFDDNQEELINDFKKAYSKAVDDIIEDSGSLKQAIETSYSGLGDGVKNAVDEADAAWREMESRFRTQVIVNSITNTTSAVMQLSSAISSVGNIDDIWNDENLTDGEKTLQIILAIVNAVSGMAQAYATVQNTIRALTTAFGKSAATGAVYSTMLDKIEHEAEDVTNQHKILKGQQDIFQSESAESAQSQLRELGYLQALAKAYRTLSAAMAENNLIRKDGSQINLVFDKGDFADIQEDIGEIFSESFNVSIEDAMKKIKVAGQKSPELRTVGELKEDGILDNTKSKKGPAEGQLSFMDLIDQTIKEDEARKAAPQLLKQDEIQNAKEGMEEIADAALKTGEAINGGKGDGVKTGLGLKGAIKGVGATLAKVPGWG